MTTTMTATTTSNAIPMFDTSMTIPLVVHSILASSRYGGLPRRGSRSWRAAAARLPAGAHRRESFTERSSKRRVPGNRPPSTLHSSADHPDPVPVLRRRLRPARRRRRRRPPDGGPRRPAPSRQPRADVPQAARPAVRRRRARSRDRPAVARRPRRALRAARLGRRARHVAGRCGDHRRARARRRRVLHLRPAADRGLLRGQQARQGLPRHEQRRLELAAVHVLRGRRLQRRVRLRRPAARLRRHRAGRLPPAARHEHRRLPSDPLGPHPRPPGRGRVRHLRRPAPHADRQGRRPAPARPARDRPGAAERAAARRRPRRARRRGVRRAPHDRLGGGPRGRARVVARARRRGLRRRRRAHRAGRPPLRERRRRDGAVVDGRQPVDGRHAEEPRRSSTSAWPAGRSAAPAAGRCR